MEVPEDITRNDFDFYFNDTGLNVRSISINHGIATITTDSVNQNGTYELNVTYNGTK